MDIRSFNHTATRQGSRVCPPDATPCPLRIVAHKVHIPGVMDGFDSRIQLPVFETTFSRSQKSKFRMGFLVWGVFSFAPPKPTKGGGRGGGRPRPGGTAPHPRLLESC